MTKRQEEIKQIEGSLDNLSHLGLIGESHVINGKRAWKVGPDHQALLLEIVKHPEKWPDHWSDEQKRNMQENRDRAIAKGLISR